MLKAGLDKKWIVLEVTNGSATDQEFDLLSLASIGASNGSAPLYFSQSIFIPLATIPSTGWTLNYDGGSFAIPASASLAGLVADLTTATGEAWTSVLGFGFFKINPVNYSPNKYTTIVQLPTTTPYVFANTIIQGGNPNITILPDGGTREDYISTIEELVNQPYLIDTVSVFADNIQQANRVWTVANRQVSGVADSSRKSPALSPNSRQFVNENIPLWFLPDATNNVKYTLGGLESAKLIFTYYKGKQLDLSDTAMADNLASHIRKMIKETNYDEVNRIGENIKKSGTGSSSPLLSYEQFEKIVDRATKPVISIVKLSNPIMDAVGLDGKALFKPKKREMTMKEMMMAVRNNGYNELP